MDDIVRQAIAKWPNVPHCFGWLGLDARGNWYMRDDRVQAAGPFPQSKGSLLKHDKLIDFIQRNYECDEHGQWFFQNGPQRVYVELEATPWVWRLGAENSVAAHTGRPARPQRSSRLSVALSGGAETSRAPAARPCRARRPPRTSAWRAAR